MYSTDDNASSLIVWMVWIHFAIMIVPVMIFTMTLEWQELKAQRKAIRKRPLRSRPPTWHPAPV